MNEFRKFSQKGSTPIRTSLGDILTAHSAAFSWTRLATTFLCVSTTCSTCGAWHVRGRRRGRGRWWWRGRWGSWRERGRERKDDER